MTFKKQIFLVLGFLTILFILSLVLFRPSPPQNISVSPTPNPSGTTTPGTSIPRVTITESASEKQRKKQAIIQMMPVIYPEFTIEYLVTSDVFMVTILQSPFDDTKEKANEWFNEQGIIDLKDLPIQYIKPRYIQ